MKKILCVAVAAITLSASSLMGVSCAQSLTQGTLIESKLQDEEQQNEVQDSARFGGGRNGGGGRDSSPNT